MTSRAANHRSESTKKPRSSNSSISSSSTLHDATPSDTTYIELSDDATEEGKVRQKSIRFSAVDLEVVTRKVVAPPHSRPRERDSSYHSPPPPRPSAMTRQSSTLAAKHRAAKRTSPQYPSKAHREKSVVAHSQVSMVAPKTIPQVDPKASHDLSPAPGRPCCKPIRSSGPPESTHSEKGIMFRSGPMPQPLASADINDVVRRYLEIPDFDFARYARDRVYVVHKVYLASVVPGTPESSLSPLDRRTECTTLTEKSVSALFSLSNLLRLSPLPIVDPDLFVVQYGGGSDSLASQRLGYAVLARKEIGLHQVILVERPCAVFPFVMAIDGPQKKPYSEAFDHLSPELRDAVHELDGKRLALGKELGGPDVDESYDYEDIVARHSHLINLRVPEGSHPYPELSAHRGLFLQASKIQHSCRPNAVWCWDLPSFSIVIRAVRPIARGEGITLAFVPPELPHAEREQRLARIKGFKCLCESCHPCQREGDIDQKERANYLNGNINTIQEGDSAREYLLRFGDSYTGLQPNINFKQWFFDKSIPEHALTSAHEKALVLIKKEGLQILDTQRHPSMTESDFDPPSFDLPPGPSRNRRLSSLSPSLSSHPSLSPPASASSSSPLSPSTKSGAPLTTNTMPCHQRDVGYHTDMLVLCYGALGDTSNFQVYLEQALKDREERSAWTLLALASLNSWSGSKEKKDDDEFASERDEARLALESKLRLVFLKWAANPATFPLWARRKKSVSGREVASPDPAFTFTTRRGAGAGRHVDVDGQYRLPACDGPGDATSEFRLFDSLDDYALRCVAFSV